MASSSMTLLRTVRLRAAPVLARRAQSSVAMLTMARNSAFLSHLASEVEGMKAAGTFKTERVITGPQGSEVTVSSSSAPVLNFCGNNYLGLSGHPALVEAAKKSLDSHGFGLSSVRFICGTT
ncbi:unnamed protein product, partial [Polarella glacialis]